MSSPVQDYQREMHDQLGFNATWLPSDRIELGEIGVFEEGRFRKEGTLADLGIAIEVSKETSPHPLSYVSATGTKITFGAGAGVAGVADGNVEIGFTKHGAYLFEAQGVRQIRIENRLKISERIIELWKAGTWKKDWYVVEDLYVADCVTVVVSLDKQASVTLAGSGGTLLIASTALSNPNAGLHVVHQSGKLVTIAGARDARPLFRCAHLKTGWFSGLELAGQPAHDGEPETRWVHGEIDDLLES